MVVVAALVLGGVAFTVDAMRTPMYTANTQLFVSTTDSNSTAAVYQGGQFSQQRVESYAQLITGDELAKRVIDRLDLELTPGQLAARTTATAIPETVLIQVTASDPSAVQARDIAAALGREFTTFVEQLESSAGEAVSPVKVTVTDQPETPSSPSSPSTARDVVLGLLVGLLVGAGVAILRARLDRSVKAPEEIVGLTGVPVMGTVLRDEELEKGHTVDRSRNSRTAEDYRQLRTNLQFINVDEPPKVIMVSSAVPAEGKTTVVVNLGLAIADAGHRVTIVEADLRKPKVTQYLGMVGGAGLTNILAGTADVDEVIQFYGAGELRVIASGPTPPNPGELLASSHMAELLGKLRGSNDYVLVDAPPLLPVADSSGLAVHTDGVLLSVRYGSTSKDHLQQAATTLHRVGAKALGVILNIVPPRADVATAYGYGYSYEPDAPRQAGKRRA
jgi:receptor protein-tyrosine kinase